MKKLSLGSEPEPWLMLTLGSKHSHPQINPPHHPSASHACPTGTFPLERML
ncbi:hypothetical protein Tsubulata_002727 [Turnera subulata]|uniref:Uncharacterized protein n=1 Tax=Turnera subulata TaxID=218843 RepID=A0A9Q0JLX8_9ROSI|nr:hypothetical protein Tsubulata_002727 [Turnera subulata]